MSALDSLHSLMEKASAPATTITPSGVLLAHTVEKARNGESVTTYELASVVKRLAFTTLSEEAIAERFSKAFGDVLLTSD